MKLIIILLVRYIILGIANYYQGTLFISNGIGFFEDIVMYVIPFFMVICIKGLFNLFSKIERLFEDLPRIVDRNSEKEINIEEDIIQIKDKISPRNTKNKKYYRLLMGVYGVACMLF